MISLVFGELCWQRLFGLTVYSYFGISYEDVWACS